jgi:hypothetical protein
MEPKHVLAAVFLAGGIWSLVAPAHVIGLTMLKPEITDATTLFVACFGAQATMCGVLFLTAKMTRAVYMVGCRCMAGSAVTCSSEAAARRTQAGVGTQNLQVSIQRIQLHNVYALHRAIPPRLEATPTSCHQQLPPSTSAQTPPPNFPHPRTNL